MNNMKIYKIVKECSLGEVGNWLETFIISGKLVNYFYTFDGICYDLKPHEIDILLALGFIKDMGESI